MSAATKKTFKSGERMAAHFLKIGTSCVSFGISWNYSEALEIAQQAVNDYQIFKNKKIRVNDDELLESLEAYSACFQLLVMQFKYRLKLMVIDDYDMLKMKDLLIVAHKMKTSLNLLHLVFDKFNSVFIWENDIKIGRIFLMLTIDCFKRMKNSESYVVQNKLKRYSEEQFDLHIAFMNLYSELLFLSAFSIACCTLIRSDVKYNENRDARELLFSDLLKILDIEDIYPTLPDAVQHFKQAQKLFDIMNPKIDEIESVYLRCIEEDVAGPTPLTSHYIHFFRGQIYHDLSCYQKDLQQHIELVEKSLNVWNSLLKDSFSKDDWQKFVNVRQNNNAVHLFVHLIEKNNVNYMRIIDYKTSNIMELNMDDPRVPDLLRELNVLRRDFVLQMEKNLDFGLMKPDLYSDASYLQLYHMIAIQYRSIILNNKKNQMSNLEKSIPYLLKLDDYMCKISKKSLRDKNLIQSQIIAFYCDLLDKTPFIQKFRKD